MVGMEKVPVGAGGGFGDIAHIGWTSGDTGRNGVGIANYKLQIINYKLGRLGRNDTQVVPYGGDWWL